MYKTYHLDKLLNIKYGHDIKELLDPEYVFIDGKNAEFNEDNNSLVYKDTMIFKNNNIYSSVSGKIINFIDNVLVIKNNFMEEFLQEHKLKKEINYSLVTLKEMLYLYGFSNTNMIKELDKPINNIIIYGVDDILYTNNYSTVLNRDYEHILEVSEILNEVIKPSNFYLTIKNTDNNNICLYNNSVGRCPFINYRFLNDEYPLYYKEILCSKLTLNPDETLVITVEELREIYAILKRRRNVSDKYISVIIEDQESFMLKVKIGTSYNDIIKRFNIDIKNKSLYLNNLLINDKANLNDSVNLKTRALYILNKDKYKEIDCINCGNCIDICPFNINIHDKKDISKCKDCGLCSYFCPAYRYLGRKK